VQAQESSANSKPTNALARVLSALNLILALALALYKSSKYVYILHMG